MRGPDQSRMGCFEAGTTDEMAENFINSRDNNLEQLSLDEADMNS